MRPDSKLSEWKPSAGGSAGGLAVGELGRLEEALAPAASPTASDVVVVKSIPWSNGRAKLSGISSREAWRARGALVWSLGKRSGSATDRPLAFLCALALVRERERFIDSLHIFPPSTLSALASALALDLKNTFG